MATDPDVVLLVADGVVFDRFDYGARIEDRLLAANLTTVRRNLAAVTREALPRAHAYLFTGGATSVSSAQPWMRAAIQTARELIDTSDRYGHVVLGICLGAQVIAEAIRPGSTSGADMIEVGLVRVNPLDKVTTRLRSLVVPAFHYEAVSPEIASVRGVRIEYGNDHSPVQAFGYGASTWACQFHPELSADDMRKLIDFNSATIREFGGVPAAAHESVDALAGTLDHDLFGETVLTRLRA